MDLQLSPRSFNLEIFLELHEASGRDILPEDCEVGLSARHRAAFSYEGSHFDVGDMAVECSGALGPLPSRCEALDVLTRLTHLLGKLYETSLRSHGGVLLEQVVCTRGLV